MLDASSDVLFIRGRVGEKWIFPVELWPASEVDRDPFDHDFISWRGLLDGL